MSHLHLYKMTAKNGEQWKILCQCPKWGNLHFYQETDAIRTLMILLGVDALKRATFISTRDDKYTTKPDPECVNALKGATFISTLMILMIVSLLENCVNALKGATFISTLTSGNPHK